MRTLCLFLLVLCSVSALFAGGCSTAPSEEERADFIMRAKFATHQFESSVTGLPRQIRNSAGYIVFPDITQWGTGLGGGTYGRGAVFAPDGAHVGWAALNNTSIGLQAGLQGFRMLIVIQDQATMKLFKDDRLNGNASAVAVAAESGGSSATTFENGVAVYQGANSGLMAGIGIGLDYIRYKPLGGENTLAPRPGNPTGAVVQQGPMPNAGRDSEAASHAFAF